MPDSETVETGRYRQRRRTRTAIVEAAIRLMRAGNGAPSVNDIAAAADVSRRTIYQYFPSVEQLLLDATLGILSETSVEEALESADRSDADAGTRVEAMIGALEELSARTLPLGRSLMKLTIDTPAADGQPIRGYRRVGWVERAIAPLRAELSEAAFERLVSALTMVVGWEALIVLQDIRGLSPEQQSATSTWAARALIDAALQAPQEG